jgi:hypothetical protein
MGTFEDKVGILAAELVFGPVSPSVPISVRRAELRLPPERERLTRRFLEICGELGPSLPGTLPADGKCEAFRRLRDEERPGWTDPLLALDLSELAQAHGRRLFTELLTALHEHVHFPEVWEYELAALYVFECHLADLLPAFFYALIDGTKGAGKTTLLDHLSRLTDSLRLQSFTLATLSRSMTKFRSVSIDEFDITEKNAEMGSATGALVRQGYKRDAAPRRVCAPKSNEVLVFEIAGPKALTFRYDLDDALKDRGFRFPMAAGSDFRLVVLGMAPEFGDLPDRLKTWAAEVRQSWTFERVCRRIKESSFEVAVRGVLGPTGATRGAELMTTALIVSEVAGVDIRVSLRQANGAREREIAISYGVEELMAALRALASRAGPGLNESECVVVAQTAVRAEIDKARKERRAFPIASGEFARLRKDALIQDEWRIKIHGYPHWKIPKEFLSERTEAPSPESPNSPERQDERVSRVSQVNPPLPAPTADRSTEPAEPLSWQEPPVPAQAAGRTDGGAS